MGAEVGPEVVVDLQAWGGGLGTLGGGLGDLDGKEVGSGVSGIGVKFREGGGAGSTSGSGPSCPCSGAGGAG